MKDSLELLSLLNLARLNSQQRARIQHLISNMTHWDQFHELININAVEVLSCQRMGEIVGVSTTALQGKTETIKQRLVNQFELLDQLLIKMAEDDIEVIVLKGALFAHTLYESPLYKKMNDIDILVKFGQAKKAGRILLDLGFHCVSETLFAKEQFSKDTHHTPPYVHIAKQCVTGIHWRLNASCRDIDGIWQRKAPVLINGIPAYRMSWEDNLLHLCIHLPFYKTGMRELADIYNLILFATPEIDWDIFLQRSCEWMVCSSVYRALALTCAMFQCADIKILSVIEDCKKRSSTRYLWDTEARIASIETLLTSRSTQIAKIEKALFVFRISKNYVEKATAFLKTWSYTLFPSFDEMKKISNARPGHYLYARIITPVLILRALCAEHGAKTIFFLTLNNIYILLKETVKLSFLKQHPPLIHSEYKFILKELE